jgi:hypothetical protein
MINRVLLLIFLLGGVVEITAQESDRTTPAPQFFVTTVVARNILRDYNIGYAHRIGSRYTLEARAGLVHPNRIVSRFHEKYLLSTDWKFKGASFYLQLNKWKYATIRKKERQMFYGLYAGYRYVYFIDEPMPMGGTEHSDLDEELILSQWRNDIMLFGTVGIRTSKFTTTEISLGVCFSFAHTHLADTRFHPYPEGTPEYEGYRNDQLDQLRGGARAFSVLPVLRISSRFGYFRW